MTSEDSNILASCAKCVEQRIQVQVHLDGSFVFDRDGVGSHFDDLSRSSRLQAF